MGPLFCYQDKTPVTREALFIVQEVQSVLQQGGVNPTPYSGHSLRIGAVSTATVTNIQDSLIYIGKVAYHRVWVIGAHGL